MSFSLYDAVVPSNLQILDALDRVMEKAKVFCDKRQLDQAELIEARLAPDTFPLGYQVKSCAVHSPWRLRDAPRTRRPFSTRPVAP
ncbi:DUF1993 family protein [Sphingomonas beigongshangi]|uniref:DUF1993 family protein n=1 Tax=Sphingomonas beigongshangi TaxID=2782540 RepID=UPI001AED39A2